MNPLRSLTAITRRALRINYQSPGICQFGSISSGSGTGSGIMALLDILPVLRLAGPASLEAEVVSAGRIELTWSQQTYIYSYVVYRATSVNGPFVQVTSNVIGDRFADTGVPAGAYFYKVTGVEASAGETLASPTVGPVEIF